MRNINIERSRRIVFIIYLVFLINNAFYLSSFVKGYKIVNTIYGEFNIKDPLILDMISNPYMKRLKKIRQYGLDYYYKSHYDYNRYDHSLGVFVLLKMFNAPILEQASGLYHDISHTAFSHLGDHLFMSLSQDSYQDKIHSEFLYKIRIDKLLSKYGLNIEDILHKSDNFKMLEQDLPNICADRLEYNLQGGYLEGILTLQDIRKILSNLKFKDKNWFFTNIDSAKKFALVPLYLSKYVWGNEQNYLINKWGAEALKVAIGLNILTIEDIKYSTDDVIWSKIKKSNSAKINTLLNKLNNIENHYKISNAQDYDVCIKNKFRGIDPLVLVNNNLINLTKLDEDFNIIYHEAKKKSEQGWFIKFIN